MMNSRKNRLTQTQKIFVVQELACFATPTQVSRALMEEHGVHLAPQNIEAYDPSKRAGASLGKKWREMFERCRAAFLEHVENSVPEAHKAVRVQKLARAARTFEAKGNYVHMADMLDRIAKEMRSVPMKGGVGADDTGPKKLPDVSTMTDEEISAELAKMFRQVGLVVTSAN